MCCVMSNVYTHTYASMSICIHMLQCLYTYICFMCCVMSNVYTHTYASMSIYIHMIQCLYTYICFMCCVMSNVYSIRAVISFLARQDVIPDGSLFYTMCNKDYPRTTRTQRIKGLLRETSQARESDFASVSIAQVEVGSQSDCYDVGVGRKGAALYHLCLQAWDDGDQWCGSLHDSCCSTMRIIFITHHIKQ
jgi:hypothetical protein